MESVVKIDSSFKVLWDDGDCGNPDVIVGNSDIQGHNAVDKVWLNN